MKILEGETGTLDPGNLDGMQPTRLGGKHSIHPSGVILGKSLEAGGRIQHETPPLAHYHGHIPLVGLLPTNPESYPESAKVPREHDVVIAESPFGARPFAIAIFLTRKGEAEPEDAFVSRGPENARIWTVDRGEFLVSVAVYTNVETFVSWPVSQVELITRLSNEGGELAFPILRGAPKVAT